MFAVCGDWVNEFSWVFKGIKMGLKIAESEDAELSVCKLEKKMKFDQASQFKVNSRMHINMKHVWKV